MKRVLICVHGFMLHDHNDFTEMKQVFDSLNTDPETEMYLVHLYDRLNKKTYSYKLWYGILEKTIKDYIQKGYEIVLIGYSFSCNLVAKALHQFPVIKKGILISPTKSVLRTGQIVKYWKLLKKSIILRLKHGNKKAKRMMDKTKMTGVIALAINVMKATLNYRHHYRHVKANLLITKGQNDELTLNTSVGEINKMVDSKYVRLVMFQGLGHNYVMHKELFMDRLYPEIMFFVFELEHNY